MARRPRSRPSRRRAATRVPTLAALLVLLGLLALVLLDRRGWLPEEVAAPVREAAREIGLPVPARQARGPTPNPSPGRAPAEVSAALAALDAIRVEPERRTGYTREDWPHWLDLDRNCLNVREEVLIEESLEPATLSPDGCRVLAGRWLDRYTGETYTDPGALDVDHVVALQEAHDSGGWDWSRDRRAAFANDREDQRTLLAVGRAVNRAKGALGPEDWLPPDPADRCRYVADWVLIKARWRLSMDERERVAVANILAECR